MKLILKILLCLFCVSSFSQDNSFNSYLKEKEKINQISEILKNNETSNYLKAINLCSQIKMERNKFKKYDLLSNLYFLTENNKKAYKYLKKAYLYGVTKKQASRYVPDMDSIKSSKIYKKYHCKYLSKIDTGLNNILLEITLEDYKTRNKSYNLFLYGTKAEKDSVSNIYINLSKKHINLYDSLIKRNNNQWIGQNIRGDNKFFKNELILVHLPIIHSDEKTNELFLDLIIKSCKRGNESWETARRIMWNQLFRFYGKHGYNKFKLRRLKFKNNLLDSNSDETLLTAYTLSIRFKGLSEITIYPTELWNGKSHKESVGIFKNLLIKFGVEDYRIKISNKVIETDPKDDVNQNYFFVFSAK